MRDVIFISHSAPLDNDFAIWLASRLQLLGYTVWIEKNALAGGEKFWVEIDQVIRNKTVKFLLVYSQNICQRNEQNEIIQGRPKDGLANEYSLAESIAKQNSLSDFIVLLNLDDSPDNLFIGADRLNQIPFHDNWAQGLIQLERKLQKDNVFVNPERKDYDFSEWYQSNYLAGINIVEKKELYYTNWWSIPKLPEHMYIYEFESAEQAEALYKQPSDYPISKITNHLSSFSGNLTFAVVRDKQNFPINPKKVYTLKVTDVLSGFESSNFPTARDAENYLKFLLKRVFHLIIKGRGMFWYEMANKRQTYYHTPASLTNSKIKFKYLFRDKEKTKNLFGKYKTLGKWHFGVSAKPIFSPLLAFSLKSHLVFTTDGFQVWRNKDNEIDSDKLHSHRRAKGKRMFNEEWRDLLLAFIHSLAKDEKIEIALAPDFILSMPFSPEWFWADFGYYDPKDNSRHGLLSTYEMDNDLRDIEQLTEPDDGTALDSPD